MSRINAILATGDGQETPKDVADVRTDKPRRVKLDGGKTPSRNLDGYGGDSSTDRSLVLDDAAPVRPFYDRYIPGGYRRDRQLSLQGRKLTLACEIFGGVAILFYGYDQGVMSGVNNAAQYQAIMGIDPTTQLGSATIGGIVAVYYAGTFFGALIGGSLGDRIGRLKSIAVGCVVATFGAALQSSAQNITWMCLARVITGSGTGILNGYGPAKVLIDVLSAIVPVWTAELSRADARGSALAFQFFLNIIGLALAYWIEFALRNSGPQLMWRLPLAIQIAFLLVLLASISLFPESPRWLARMGDEAEARHILARLRTEAGNEQDPGVNSELDKILEVVQLERQNAAGNHYGVMMRNTDRYKIGRRVRLVVWLQIMQELVGIGVVTVYAPTVFLQAGFSSYLSDLLSGINDLSYAASVLIAVFTLDRVGRRVTLYWGALVMGFSLILCGIAGRFVADPASSTAVQRQWGIVLAAFIFLYTATFGATWLTVPWLYPTEIMPLHVRAKGGAFSVIGWSIGNGVVVVLTPFLFNAIGYGTFLLFAGLNFATLPFIWALYPETAGRSLEDMDELFEGSIFVRRARQELEVVKRQDKTLE